MEGTMLTSFMDELSKIADAGSNAAAPAAMKSGMGGNSMASASRSTGISQSTSKAPSPKSNISAKPQNYSIVHSEAPMAAQGVAASTSKMLLPPPVRT